MAAMCKECQEKQIEIGRMRIERAEDCRFIAQVREALSDVLGVINDRQRSENERLREALSDVLEVVSDRQVPVKDRITNVHTVATLALERKGMTTS